MTRRAIYSFYRTFTDSEDKSECIPACLIGVSCLRYLGYLREATRQGCGIVSSGSIHCDCTRPNLRPASYSLLPTAHPAVFVAQTPGCAYGAQSPVCTLWQRTEAYLVFSQEFAYPRLWLLLQFTCTGSSGLTAACFR